MKLIVTLLPLLPVSSGAPAALLERVEHDLCLHAGDAIDVQSMLTLEVFHHSDRVPHRSSRSRRCICATLQRVEAAAQPAYAIALHASRQCARRCDLRPPQHQIVAVPEARDRRDRHVVLSAGEPDLRALPSFETRDGHLVRVAGIVDEREDCGTIQACAVVPRNLADRRTRDLAAVPDRKDARRRDRTCRPTRRTADRMRLRYWSRSRDRATALRCR